MAALTNAERQAKWRERRQAEKPPPRHMPDLFEVAAVAARDALESDDPAAVRETLTKLARMFAALSATLPKPDGAKPMR